MAIKMPAFDWAETKDYALNWTDEMEKTSDGLATVEFDVLTPSSGLGVASSDIDGTKKFARVWFTADNALLLQALAGDSILINHTVTTEGGRTLNVTLKLPIKDK